MVEDTQWHKVVKTHTNVYSKCMKCFTLYKLYLNRTNIALEEPQEGTEITSLYFTGNKPKVLKRKLLLVINCKPPDTNRTFLQHYMRCSHKPGQRESDMLILFTLSPHQGRKECYQQPGLITSTNSLLLGTSKQEGVHHMSQRRKRQKQVRSVLTVEEEKPEQSELC